jgi:hypothetical protein
VGVAILRRALLLAALGVAAGPAAAARADALTGGWQQLVNCAPTSYNLLTGDMICNGSSLWSGSLTGLTQYTFSGHFDLLSGSSSGTVTETFTDQHGDGTLSFTEKETVDGPSGAYHLDATVTAATGIYAGKTGTIVFDGVGDAATANGTYTGTLAVPITPSSVKPVKHKHKKHKHKKQHHKRH